RVLEVRPDRKFKQQEVVPISGSIEARSEAQHRGAETRKGAAEKDDDNSVSLSGSDPVCITDQNLPVGSKKSADNKILGSCELWTVIAQKASHLKRPADSRKSALWNP
ncbi:MAG: hypothetical protein P8J33_15440, partial [Pirellulaceae bacterium]|nr:hypothetical protein [Pirellulaceae bacterium]